MPIDAIVDQPSDSDDKRGAARWRIRLEVPGSFNNELANVLIHDISTAGMLIETKSQLEIGQDIAVSLPEAEHVNARVVWQDEPLFGCRFDQPLPQAALSAVRLRNPVSQEEARPVEVDVTRPGPSESLGERLKRLRRERGMSRTALSQRSGFSKPSLWAWETGKTTPRRSNLIVLAAVFGMTEQQLLLGETPLIIGEQRHIEGDRSSDQLGEVIDAAKNRIAQAVGVQVSQVRVYIEY